MLPARRMAFFSSTKVVGEPPDTQNFKYPQKQKSARVKSGDCGGGRQPKLTTSTDHSVFSESVQQESLDFTCKGKASLSWKAGTTWSHKSIRYRSVVTVQVFQAGYRTITSKNKGHIFKGYNSKMKGPRMKDD